MDRRLFLGSILGLALQSTAARAQSQGVTQFDPNPSFVNVQMIVVGYVSILSEDRSLLKGFEQRSLESEVAEFVQSQFKAAGYPVISVDQSRLGMLPQGVTDAEVLHVRFRIDLSSVRAADNSEIVVGAVSTYFRRLENELISWEPIKQFVVEGDRSAVTTRAKQALLEQAQKSVVDMIVDIKKHGF